MPLAPDLGSPVAPWDLGPALALMEPPPHILVKGKKKHLPKTVSMHSVCRAGKYTVRLNCFSLVNKFFCKPKIRKISKKKRKVKTGNL